MISPVHSQSQRLLKDVHVDRLVEEVTEAIQSKTFFDFSSLSPEELCELLDTITCGLEASQLDYLAEILPLEALESAVRIRYPTHVAALETAKELLEGAKFFLASTDGPASPSISAYLTSLLNSLIAIFETFLRAFGIADFFRSPENPVEGEFKSQKIMQLLTLYSMVSGILIPLLGAELGAMIIGGILLGISALSLIYPLFKPQSTKLPRGENWSEQYQLNELKTAEGRKETLDEMARTLIASQGTKNHVLLLGKTGIGKTSTAQAFVQAVERGDYPELKGKQIFYFNTAELAETTEMFVNSNKILKQISEEMGKYRDQFILIFDEIHIACQSGGSLAEKLKTYLDPGKDKFPYFIGITTEEEYYTEIYPNHSAFARRFKKIVLQNTEPDETLKILSLELLKQAPATLVEPNALQALLQKTNDAFGATVAQPASCLKILSQCINRTAASQRSPLERKVEAVRGRIQSQYAQRAGALSYRIENLAPALREELIGLEAELERVNDEIQQIFADRERLLEIKKSTMQRIVNMPLESESLSAGDKQQLNLFLLESHFQSRLIESKIKHDAAKLNIKVTIDEALIDEVIAEEQENDRRVQEAIDQGRDQIAARE